MSHGECLFFVSFFWKQTALSALLVEACKISFVLRAVSIQFKRSEMKQLVKIYILYNMKKLFFILDGQCAGELVNVRVKAE